MDLVTITVGIVVIAWLAAAGFIVYCCVKPLEEDE